MIRYACAALAIVLVAAVPGAAQEVREGAAPRDEGWSLRWADHPEIEWSGKLRVEFRARLQEDSRASRAAVERLEGDAFDVGRRRVGIAGEPDGAGNWVTPAGYQPWTEPTRIDTTVPGLGSAGHDAPFDQLSEADKTALTEYLKLL